MNQQKSVLKVTLLSILCTLLTIYLVYRLQIPNPVIVLIIPMILFETIGGLIPGAASGMLIIVYALFYFSTYHRFQHYTEVASYKCFVVAMSLLAIYLLVGKLKQYTDQINQRMARMNRELQKTNEVLENASDHDPLTGIYNRRGGNKMLVRCIEWIGTRPEDFEKPQARKRKPAILAILDVDNFKQINDAYGHAAGDLTLQYLVKSMQETFPQDSIFIRHGGDEFQMLLQSPQLEQMEKLLQEFAEREFRFPYQDDLVSFHISCGYALYPEQATTVEDLYLQADTALYFVKMNGKHKAALYDKSMDLDARTQFHFSLMDVFAGLPVAVIIYQADEAEQILLATQSAVELFGCQSWQEFMQYTGGSFRNLVHPDDVERVEQSIAQQVATNAQQLDSVEYRIITKDHKTKKIHDIGRMTYHPRLGNLFYVVLYDKDTLSL